jgi:crossover junction endodeoxyribonuclease RuvC
MTIPIKAIGIDPGLASTGFAIIETLEKRGRACHWGDIKTSSDHPFPERLHSIYRQLSEILSCWQPHLLVAEGIYVYSKFPKAAIQLGSVRGVIYLAAHHQGIDIYELKPTEVKSALTGNGRASKQQVERMVQKILNIGEIVTPHHASDALALAITGLSRSGYFRW